MNSEWIYKRFASARTVADQILIEDSWHNPAAQVSSIRFVLEIYCSFAIQIATFQFHTLCTTQLSPDSLEVPDRVFKYYGCYG